MTIEQIQTIFSECGYEYPCNVYVHFDIAGKDSAFVKDARLRRDVHIDEGKNLLSIKTEVAQYFFNPSIISHIIIQSNGSC